MWKYVAIVFMLLSIFLAYVAIHNSRQLACQDMYKNALGNYCVIKL